MKQITAKWLKKHKACCSIEEMKQAEKIGDPIKIVRKLKKLDRFFDANWLLTRLMKKNQCRKYTIYAAELILHIFEKRYPYDDRPRKAIEAAKRYLKNPTLKNKRAVYATAAYAYAADATAAADAAYVVAYAYAADATAAIAVVAAVDDDIKNKIINYGIKLLKEEIK